MGEVAIWKRAGVVVVAPHVEPLRASLSKNGIGVGVEDYDRIYTVYVERARAEAVGAEKAERNFAVELFVYEGEELEYVRAEDNGILNQRRSASPEKQR